jgi:RNA polymerase sigma factor (sigma-70 family)
MANRQIKSVVGQFCKLLTAQPSSQLTDQQLLQRCLTMREEAAFATLVERHGPMVLGVCRSVLRHAQDAEDVCQATFLVLARKAISIRKPTSLAHWLHGVAYRLAIRARANRDQIFDRRANDRSQPNPMDELTGRELRQILHEELDRLPESYRTPLILCYLEGQTQDEAAGQLRWTAATLKGRIDRGRESLAAPATAPGIGAGAAAVRWVPGRGRGGGSSYVGGPDCTSSHSGPGGRNSWGECRQGSRPGKRMGESHADADAEGSHGGSMQDRSLPGTAQTLRKAA